MNVTAEITLYSLTKRETLFLISWERSFSIRLLQYIFLSLKLVRWDQQAHMINNFNFNNSWRKMGIVKSRGIKKFSGKILNLALKNKKLFDEY